MGDSVVGSGDNTFTFGNGGTDSTITMGGTSISAPSDIRLKENIQDEIVGLDFINDLRPVTFQWKKAKDISSEMNEHIPDSEERVMNGKFNHGFIAQEVKETIDKYSGIKEGFDMWSKSGSDDRQRIGETALIPMLVKSVQELSTKNDALLARIVTLEG
jgi:trimeric autotransporter adhesin